MDDDIQSKGKAFLLNVCMGLAVCTAIFLATGTAYILFQATRSNSIGFAIKSFFLSIGDVFKTIGSLDPVVAAWALPLGGGLIIVIGMLVYRHFDR